jgi:hypothetical protein
MPVLKNVVSIVGFWALGWFAFCFDVGGVDNAFVLGPCGWAFFEGMPVLKT